MPWFAVGIALWVLLLLVCWVALDCNLTSTWSIRRARPEPEEPHPRSFVSSEPHTHDIEPPTFANHNEVSP